jgi:hypothetical protein
MIRHGERRRLLLSNKAIHLRALHGLCAGVNYMCALLRLQSRSTS